MRRRARRQDRGLTLPELLIVVTIMGTLSAVIASASIVSLRQSNETEGRVNVARSETSIDTWLPADLASTDVNDTTLPAVDLDPAAEPCTTTCNGIDLSGTNALQLAWRTSVSDGAGGADEIVTRVQYQYIQVGDDWRIRRISCVGGEPCTVVQILDGLEGPPDPSTFDADADSPIWVLDVAVPDNASGLELGDNARKIVVTIDGGGDTDGAGGGVNTISLTAGGRVTEEIDPDDFTVPSFVRAKSRCGGPITLIADDSGSIGDAVDTVVKPGIRAFIEAFRGTPTQVQIVPFSAKSWVLGPNTADTSVNDGWHRYIPMTNDALVDQLLLDVETLDSSGATNYESAFFRTFKESDGTTAAVLPTRLVFFTDGGPTVHRASGTSTDEWDPFYYNGTPNIHYNDGVYEHPDWAVNWQQEPWDRADVILDQHRNVDMVFAAVGPGLNDPFYWSNTPAVYTDRTVPPPPWQVREAWETVAHLLVNGPSGHVTAQLGTNDEGETIYTNGDVADFYRQESFDAEAFAAAMRTAALKDCGGTLTIQTRDADTGAPIEDEFIYENPRYRDDQGQPVEGAELRKVTTSASFRTGTFDFELSDSTQFFSVDVVPAELQTLEGYTMTDWSCRVGAVPKTTTAIPIDGSSFEGITVDVAVDEAVSCIMSVRPS